MRAFDPLFRARRRRMMIRRGTNGIGVLGLAGLGFAVYRLLQTERGRAVKNIIVEQVRERMPSTSRGGRVRTQAGGIGSQTF